MTSRFLSAIFLSFFLISGCTSSRGFNRGELRTGLGELATDTSDAEIAKTLSLKPQLPFPFTIGVYFKEPENKNGNQSVPWHWSEDDKEKILATAAKLQTSGQVSKVFTIHSSLVSGTDLRSLRLAAAQHGADALLVVSGANDADHYNNKWSWTYLALATMLFVPADQLDVLFLSRAALWDVRNQYLYMTAEAEGAKSQTRPAAFTDEREALAEAKTESLRGLGAEIARMAEEISKKKQGGSVSEEQQGGKKANAFRSQTLNKSPFVPISF
jgi:hypothetical protein